MNARFVSSVLLLLLWQLLCAWAIDPVCPGGANCLECPGPDCDVLTVTSYQDSTRATTHSILCYSPTSCSGSPVCPLYVWIDATGKNFFREVADKVFLREMVRRGFVSCAVQYDDSSLGYFKGCPSFERRSRDIFDLNRAGSLTNQVCGVYANCSKGIATHGFSQGAHIVALARNYAAVTAALLFGNGNFFTFLILKKDVSCMNDGQQALPKERRRSIVGVFDDRFGSKGGVLAQQKATSGYDCGSNFDCLGTDNGAGYHIAPGGDHSFFFAVNDGANSQFTNAFLNDDDIWGLTSNFDWLAAVATTSDTTQRAN
jgi:hypothetical protein